jgi:ATP-dependent helicase IRC3
MDNKSIQLRNYQSECLSVIKQRYQQGIRRQLICLPTGTGKTVIFSRFPEYFRMKKRMLVLAHREELLYQAREKIRHANPQLSVGIEQADQRAEENVDVVVASVQTLGRKNSKRLAELKPEMFYLIVVDEAHHATADTYKRILDYLGVFRKKTLKLMVGFTATPKRGDGQGLDGIFQEIVYSRTLPEMIDASYLSPLAAYRIETEIDLSHVHTRMGDFVTSQLSAAVNIGQRNKLVIDVFQERLSTRQTICFCVDVAHAHSLALAFRKAGFACEAVTGELKGQVRQQILRRFRNKHLKVLTNCLVLTEGYDEPSIEGIILARPTKSPLLYAQMIGRGTRLHPGKENVTIIDIADVTRDHKLVSLSTLFGLPYRFNPEGRTTQEVQRAIQWVETYRPWVRTDLATSISDLRYRCRRINLFDLQTPDEMTTYSNFAWIQIGPNQYRLNLINCEHITISPTILGEWEVLLNGPKNEQIIGETKDLEDAVIIADDFVRKQRKDAVRLVYGYSRWRREPASSKQIRILKSYGLKIPKKLYKGQASHIIAMMLNGRKR